MNRAQRRAERATWAVFADTVAETVGFDIPLHRAAKDAALGLAGAGERFYALLDGLDVDARARLLGRLSALDADRNRVARQYASAGRV